jgi:dipeptidyl aminopeptidase/acylaminoacyl peptidase
MKRLRDCFGSAVLRRLPGLPGATRRCLTKDRRQRLQSIGEARIALEQVEAGAPLEELSAPVEGFRRSILPWAAAGVLAVVAATAGWIAWRATRPVDHPLLRLSVDLGPDAVASDGITAAISPDGTRLAFPVRGADGKRQLATRLLDKPLATLLSGTGSAFDPFFSPDGQWIGFFAKGKLNKVSVTGGAVVALCDAPDPRGGAWGEDDNIIAALNSLTGFGLSRIPAAGGTPAGLTKPADSGDGTHRWPQILPGGQAVMFMGNKTAGGYDTAYIEVLSLKTGKVKVVQRGGYFGRYLPAGYLTYIHQGTLFGVPFDLQSLEVRGTPAPLLENVATNLSIGGGQLDFSRNGTLVYLSGKSSLGTWPLVWLDRAGKIQPLLNAPREYLDLRLSPDGKRLAFATGAGIEVYDLGRDTMTRLTFGTSTAQIQGYPVWALDAKHIVFQTEEPGKYSLQWIRSDGAGEAQRLFESTNELRPYSLSPDAKRVAFAERNPETGFDLWTLPLDTSDQEHPKAGTAELFLRTRQDEQDPAFSPDGHWIAYASTTSGVSELFVRPFPAGGSSGSGQWLISVGGGQFPIWSRHRQELFYEGLDNRIMAAGYSAKGNSFSAEKPHPWSNTQLLDLAVDWNLDLAPDGNRFVVVLPRTESAGETKNSVHVTFLLNFFDEVRRRIPNGK